MLKVGHDPVTLRDRKMNLNELLSAATDHLTASARANAIGHNGFGAMVALRDAADALYDAAERIAAGEPAKVGKMGQGMALALHVAEAKLSELDRRWDVRAVTRDAWRAPGTGGMDYHLS